MPDAFTSVNTKPRAAIFFSWSPQNRASSAIRLTIWISGDNGIGYAVIRKDSGKKLPKRLGAARVDHSQRGPALVRSRWCTRKTSPLNLRQRVCVIGSLSPLIVRSGRCSALGFCGSSRTNSRRRRCGSEILSFDAIPNTCGEIRPFLERSDGC